MQVNAMSALADLAAEHPRLREGVRERIEVAMESGSPAVQARGRKLLDGLASAE